MDFLIFLWSWRDSNPRPNKQQISFLHAQFIFNCRHNPENKHSVSCLASKISESVRSTKIPILTFPCPFIKRRKSRLLRDIQLLYLVQTWRILTKIQNYAAKAYSSLPVKKLKCLIKVSTQPVTACLLTHWPCCQNQSAPQINVKLAFDGCQMYKFYTKQN